MGAFKFVPLITHPWIVALFSPHSVDVGDMYLSVQSERGSFHEAEAGILP